LFERIYSVYTKLFTRSNYLNASAHRNTEGS
jgi:hypothetical protein